MSGSLAMLGTIVLGVLVGILINVYRGNPQLGLFVAVVAIFISPVVAAMVGSDEV